ncbi:MAG: DUF6173 family protein [Cocleimonas sp.]
MQAVRNDFPNENILNSNLLRSSKTVLANCQVLISPKTIQNISNTDIVIWINDLHKALDNEHEAGIQIDHLGKQIIFYINHIAHKNHSMIYFKGQTVDGKQVHFVKHLPDLSIQLMVLKRRSANQLKIPFGFIDWDHYENAKSKIALD